MLSIPKFGVEWKRISPPGWEIVQDLSVDPQMVWKLAVIKFRASCSENGECFVLADVRRCYGFSAG